MKNRKESNTKRAGLGTIQRQKYYEATNKGGSCGWWKVLLGGGGNSSHQKGGGKRPKQPSVRTVVMTILVLFVSFVLMRSGKDDTAGGAGSSSSAASGASPLRNPNGNNAATTTSATTAAAAAAAATPTEPSAYPPSCTPELTRKVLTTLPGDRCFSEPWTQQCSFTVRTRGCQNPQTMREYYTSSEFQSTTTNFVGIVVGWRDDDEPLDMLYVGSSPKQMDTSKFDSLMNQWNTKVPGSKTNSCRQPVKKDAVETSTIGRTRILVIERESYKYQRLQQLRSDLSLSDPSPELVVDNTDVGQFSAADTFTRIVQTKLGIDENQPIHYVNLIGSAASYPILSKQLDGFLKRIRYLTFEYNWKDDWGSDFAGLSPIIKKLKDNGLVCYFAGDSTYNFKLWRITDCWLSHYSNKNWSRIACVNVLHNDVKGLATQMEQKFMSSI
jgi:hypothetical protein